MAQVIPENIQLLADSYAKAYANLLKLLQSQIDAGTLTIYTESLIVSVEDEIRVLDDFQEKWINKNLPPEYAKGVDQSYTEFRRQNIDVKKVEVNGEIIKNLIDNTIKDMSNANAYIGRHVVDTLRQVGLDVSMKKFTEGRTIRETQRILINTLTTDGLLNIKDKNGKSINPEAYANMVGRTTTREATNRGALEEITGNDHDLVYVPTHNSSCPLCATLEGRVYSISGKSTKYPKLSKLFRNGYSTIHPNCKHNVLPYVPEFDKNAKTLQEYSNKPFVLTQDTQKRVDRYDKEQAKLKERRDLKDEWKKKRFDDPQNTPKTFSGYLAKLTREKKKNDVK